MDVGITKVFHGELLTSVNDCGYITYVFRNLDESDILHRYLMCTRFPNWNSPFVEIGDKGFVEYREVIAGKDKWFDGVNYVPYKYTDIHFLDFIYEKEKLKNIVLC